MPVAAAPRRGPSPLDEALFCGLFARAADISGTSKKKADGSLAATRLKKPVTSIWLNERFRQTLFLIREFRTNWNKGTMLSNDDVEYLRVALDTALAQAEQERHVGDIYDLNPTIWAILLVQNLHAVRMGDWAVHAVPDQVIFSMTGMYRFLEAMHARGDLHVIRDPATKEVLHRYRLPFKANMTMPPRATELFKFRKGANRLSDWMEAGGMPALHPEIINLQTPKVVPIPPLQAARAARRDALWRRVTQRVSRRSLQSVTGADVDSRETRAVVSDLMAESRADTSSDSEMSNEQVDAFAAELEVELEEQQAPGGEGSLAERQITAIEEFLLGDAGASSSGAGSSSSSNSESEFSAYEQQRLRNIAANQQMLETLGLGAGPQLAPARSVPPRERDPFPPGRSGAPPTRRTSRDRPARSYEERGSSADDSDSN